MRSKEISIGAKHSEVHEFRCTNQIVRLKCVKQKPCVNQLKNVIVAVEQNRT